MWLSFTVLPAISRSDGTSNVMFSTKRTTNGLFLRLSSTKLIDTISGGRVASLLLCKLSDLSLCKWIRDLGRVLRRLPAKMRFVSCDKEPNSCGTVSNILSPRFSTSRLK